MIVQNLQALKSKSDKFFSERRFFIVSILSFLTFFLVFYNFTNTPRVWVDEGVFTEVAKNLALHGVLGLQTSPGVYFPMNNFLLSTSYPVIVPVAVSFYTFGTGILQARIPMAVYMILLVLSFYLFSRKRYGFVVAISSVLFLLSFSPFYGNGRPVQGEVPGLAFMVFGSLILLYLEESGFKNKKFAVFSGLLFGFSASTKPIFTILLSASLFVSMILVFRRIKDKRIVYTFLLGYLPPVLLWFYIHFPDLTSITKIIEPFLFFASNHSSDMSTSSVFVKNLLKFLTESTPVLFATLLIVTIISAFYVSIKERENKLSMSEIVLLSFITLNWFAFLFGTGWYRYFFPANTLIYLMFPGISLIFVCYLKREWLKNIYVLFCLTLICFQFIHLIFLSDNSLAKKRTGSNELSEIMSKIDPSKTILIYNTIDASAFVKGSNYNQYLSMGDFLEAGDKNIDHNKFHYILIDKSSDVRAYGNCYKSKIAGKFLLMEKNTDCVSKRNNI